MLRFSILLFALAFVKINVAQTVTIKGLAPAYAGKTIEINGIEDYFSYSEKLIASTTVRDDSTFDVTFNCPKTKKIVVSGMNNSGHMYVQPGSTYKVLFPDRDKFDPYRPNGNQVEISFLGLDSTDINYKILGFQRWIDHFVGNNFYLKSREPKTFGENLDRFKTNVEKAYKEDTSSYFKTYVRFSIAALDNIGFAGERNRYEKHDFYIKHSPVEYGNDAYMEYIKDFYQEIISRLSSDANQKVYDGIIKSSPSEVMRGLGGEYTLVNLRIREMIMLNALSEVYNSGSFPQTNILTIMDSVENHALFEANKVIARNLKNRLTQLVPGGKAPDFVLSETGKDTKTLFGYQEKYLYIHFANPNELSTLKELDLLKDLHKRYSKYVNFVTVYKDDQKLDSTGVNALENLGWDVYKISPSNSIWKKYRVEAFPQYTLIDGSGHVIASPALRPLPNGQYETIDKTFFFIKESYERRHQEVDPYNRND